jgi:ABC-type glycerol-3-phosphate transport system substrate-binding protein
MVMSGPWNLALLRDLPKVEFDVVMPPRDVNAKTRLITGCYAMFNKCKHKEAAWKLLRYMTATQGGVELNIRSRLSPLQSVQRAIKAGDYSFLEDQSLLEEYEWYLKYLKKFIRDEDELYFLNFPREYDALDRHINRAIEDLELGHIDGRKYMGRVVNRFIEDDLFEEQFRGQEVNKDFYLD